MRRAGGENPIAPVSAVSSVKGGVTGVLGIEGGQAAQGAANAAKTEPAAKAAENSAAGKDLEKALADTVSYMADKFGDKAATAMIGLVYKRVGDGAVTEENLGNALLDVVKFVDQNFGIEAGDGLIEHLNGTLNDSLNAYFDNGSNEDFLAVTKTASGVTVNGTDLGVSFADSLADSINAILEQYAAMRKKPAKAQPPYGDLTDPAQAKGILLDAAA